MLLADHPLTLRVEVELASSTTAIHARGDGFGGTVKVTTAGRTDVTPLLEDNRTTPAIDDALDELTSGGADRLFAEATLLRALAASLEGAPATASGVAE